MTSSSKKKLVLVALLSFALGGASVGGLMTWVFGDRISNIAAVPPPHASAQATATLPSPPPTVAANEPPPETAQEATPNASPNKQRKANGQSWRERMASPEFAKAIALQQRAALDEHFAALFRKLNLPPEALAKFKALLVDKQSTMRDVMMSARSEGLDPRSDSAAFKKLVADSTSEIDASIQSLLSADQYQAYQNYVSSLPEQNLINQVNQRLSYSGTSLTDSQALALAQIVSSSDAAAGIDPQTRPLDRSAILTEEALQQASSFLSSDQLEALKQIQEEQAAMRNLRRPPPGGP